ncbi:MAG: hypothetical protein CNE95_01380 [Puniceicoccaceae bacterium MED-G30]|nr:MAG: hypothetical protein CNE95_01380 [Puniceicoccaceae bacterium MED-G30]
MKETLEKLDALIELARLRAATPECWQNMLRQMEQLAQDLREEAEAMESTMKTQQAMIKEFDGGKRLRLLPSSEAKS